MVTQQPVGGQKKKSSRAQRIGEIEMWALEGFGASYILNEILTIKSDFSGRRPKLLKSILNNNQGTQIDITSSFRMLASELQALCLDLILYNPIIKDQENSTLNLHISFIGNKNFYFL